MRAEIYRSMGFICWTPLGSVILKLCLNHIVDFGLYEGISILFGLVLLPLGGQFLDRSIKIMYDLDTNIISEKTNQRSWHVRN